MKVYPVNKLPLAEIFSPDIAAYSNVENVYHSYLKHRSYGNKFTLTLNLSWNKPIRADTLIIADNNFQKTIITLKDSFNVEKSFTFWNIQEHRNFIIIPLDSMEIDLFNIVQGKLEFSDTTEQIYCGYIFIGKSVELPRFIVAPEWEKVIRGESNRTNGGQVYGLTFPSLDRLAVSFVRIYRDEKKIVDDYMESVQGLIPHIVDLYPETHGELILDLDDDMRYNGEDLFPPRYATLQNGISATKRNENDFYWNYAMEWLEAK